MDFASGGVVCDTVQEKHVMDAVSDDETCQPADEQESAGSNAVTARVTRVLAANVDDSLPAHSLELEKVDANVTTPEPFMSSDDAQEDIEEELYLYFKRKFRYA
ncbi:hypothetical protein HDU77_007081 [Chytriomyces hyalinus]|nr:hypothetical protein HDU77_007081 [Chytriomyces hyalinus]